MSTTHRGTRFYRTVTPKDLPLGDCTPAANCLWGYNSRGAPEPPVRTLRIRPGVRLPGAHDDDPRAALDHGAPDAGSDRTLRDPPRRRHPPVRRRVCVHAFARCPRTGPPTPLRTRPEARGPDAIYTRVTGDFTGTTDEIIQWTACKWGIDEDWVRAQIVNESNWQQTATGDFTTDSNACAPGFPIGTYPPQYNGDSEHRNECPESIGLGQVRWLYHQSAFADDNAVKSSAYNLDYTYAVWRECFEGRFGWLNDVEGRGDYAAGDAKGCLGVWFSGRWYTDAAQQYIARFDSTLGNRTWDQQGFPAATPDGGTPTITTTPPTLAGTNTTTTVTPATTAAPTSTTTTVAPTTTSAPTTVAPTTTASPTTAAPTPTTAPTTSTTLPTPPTSGNGVVFVETFDDGTGSSLDTHVFHRNIDIHDYAGFSGGTWTGDHDLACGSPDSQRTLRFNANDSQATRRANSFYSCRGHWMSSMGDVENYSIAAFSPKQVFDDVRSVEVDVSLTDLGNRQWLKFGVLSTRDCPALDTRCMYSDVAASDLPTNLATSGRLIASWSGGLSAGYPGGLKVGNTGTNKSYSAGADKATRHPVSLVDNGNGTVTFTVAGQSATVAGSFPECPCRVVFYDHSYTPNKNEWAPGTQRGYTYHWDNIVVRN